MSQTALLYIEFINCMRENIEARLEEMGTACVSVTEIVKNNGVVFDTLTIAQKGEECSIVFYLKDLYDEYLSGESMENLTDQVLAKYMNRMKDRQIMDFRWVHQFESVADRVVLRAVNYEQNRQQLERAPHIRRLDLALTFRILVEQEREQVGTFLVTNEMMQMWGQSESELFDRAVKNTSRLWQPVLEPLHAMVQTLMLAGSSQQADAESIADWPQEDQMPMYVLTNDMRVNGATMLFCGDNLEKFADRQRQDIFVLPSSIHEVLLLPVSSSMSAKELRRIVQSVNQQMVSDEEILSDHVYRYLVEEKRLVIAA